MEIVGTVGNVAIAYCWQKQSSTRNPKDFIG